MVAAKKSTALKTVDNNAKAPVVTAATPAKQAPVTPGKQVRALKADLEVKDAENKALLDQVANLSKALESLNLVKGKMDGAAATAPQQKPKDDASEAPKRVKKDKAAPLPAKTAYKYFCEATDKPEDDADMRKVWKECPADVRAKFVAMAEVDKTRFLTESKQYNDEKAALDMYYQKKKEDIAMEFFEAHQAAQAALEKANAEKKKKKVIKDPEAPKRPTSSYMYFAIEQREATVKAHPEAPVTEISKILGESWNKLEKGKAGKKGTKKYDDMAAKDKARYETEKAAYDEIVAERKAQTDQETKERLQQEKEEAIRMFQQQAAAVSSTVISTANQQATDDLSAITDENTKQAKERKKKDPNAPKKACSAYLYYCTENRAAVKAAMAPTTTQGELLTEIGRRWKETPDADKAKYNAKADADKARYAKEMETYNAGKAAMA